MNSSEGGWRGRPRLPTPTGTRLALAMLALSPLAASLAPRLLHAQQVETVYEITSPLWYEDAARFYRVSPDGRRAQYGSGPLVHFIDLTRHAEVSLPPGDTLPPPDDAHYRLGAG